MNTDVDLIWMEEKTRTFLPPHLRPRFDEIVRTRMKRYHEDPVAAAIDRLGEKLDPLIEAASRPQYVVRDDQSGPEPPPDAGLEEGLRKWATTKFCHLTAETGAGFRAAQSDVLTILGAPRAKPEPEPEPPPNAGVTREEPTLRDRFAMAALTGMIGDSELQGECIQYARGAYQYADAMLAARLRREEESE